MRWAMTMMMTSIKLMLAWMAAQTLLCFLFSSITDLKFTSWVGGLSVGGDEKVAGRHLNVYIIQ